MVRNEAREACVDELRGLWLGTNWHPFKDYSVQGSWIEELWGDDKLEDAYYMELSLQLKRGHATRKRDFKEVAADQAAKRVDARIREVDTALAKLRAPFRTFEAVDQWEETFLHLRFRWDILALTADSASGKSNFAESRFANPYVLTIEEAQNLDLRDFDYWGHDGLVLDNVNSWGQLLLWRAVLQGRNAKSKGGQSATNLYSYVQYMYGVPVIATVDLDAPDRYLVDPQHKDRSNWLCKNVRVLALPRGEKFFDEAQVPTSKVENTFSLFAQTVKRRRELAAC